MVQVLVSLASDLQFLKLRFNLGPSSETDTAQTISCGYFLKSSLAGVTDSVFAPLSGIARGNVCSFSLAVSTGNKYISWTWGHPWTLEQFQLGPVTQHALGYSATTGRTTQGMKNAANITSKATSSPGN